MIVPKRYPDKDECNITVDFLDKYKYRINVDLLDKDERNISEVYLDKYKNIAYRYTFT